MAGALPHYKQGPATYPAASLILGGQLVVPNSATAGDLTVKVCPVSGTFTGASQGPLGVAGSDANALTEPIFPSGNDPSGTTDSLLDLGFVKPEVAVYNNVDIVVNYDGSGAVNFGQKLTWSAATAGSVAPYTGTDPKLIVGYCSQPGGVTASAQTARAFIHV